MDSGNTAVTGDITYTAQFSASKRSYNVTYNTNGGTIANETNYTSYTCGTALTLRYRRETVIPSAAGMKKAILTAHR